LHLTRLFWWCVKCTIAQIGRRYAYTWSDLLTSVPGSLIIHQHPMQCTRVSERVRHAMCTCGLQVCTSVCSCLNDLASPAGGFAHMALVAVGPRQPSPAPQLLYEVDESAHSSRVVQASRLRHVHCTRRSTPGPADSQLGVEQALGGKEALGSSWKLLEALGSSWRQGCLRARLPVGKAACGLGCLWARLLVGRGAHVCGCVAEAHSKLRSDDHQLFHAMSPIVSMTATSTNIGVKSRPLASNSHPVKYWPDAPAMTAKTDVPP